MALCTCAPSQALHESERDTAPFQRLEPGWPATVRACKKLKSQTAEIKKSSKYLVKRGDEMHLIRTFMKLRSDSPLYICYLCLVPSVFQVVTR